MATVHVQRHVDPNSPLIQSYPPVETPRMRPRHSSSEPAVHDSRVTRKDGTLIDPLCPRSSTRIPGCYSSRPLSFFTLRQTRASSG